MSRRLSIAATFVHGRRTLPAGRLGAHVDFIAVAWSGLLNAAAKIETFSGGRWQVPMVVRAACGGGYGDGGRHEQVLWGALAAIPSLKVVVPSTPADAAGLLLSAVRDPSPVVLLEHKLLTASWRDWLGGEGRPGVAFDVPQAGARGAVPDPVRPVPIGEAARRRDGTDVALLSLGVGVHRALAAAAQLADSGIEATVLDLRNVAPLDTAQILDVAQRTGRLVVIDEDYRRGGLSGEVAALLAETDVEARYARVTVETTIPSHPLGKHRHCPPSRGSSGPSRTSSSPDGPSHHPDPTLRDTASGPPGRSRYRPFSLVAGGEHDHRCARSRSTDRHRRNRLCYNLHVSPPRCPPWGPRSEGPWPRTCARGP